MVRSVGDTQDNVPTSPPSADEEMESLLELADCAVKLTTFANQWLYSVSTLSAGAEVEDRCWEWFSLVGTVNERRELARRAGGGPSGLLGAVEDSMACSWVEMSQASSEQSKQHTRQGRGWRGGREEYRG